MAFCVSLEGQTTSSLSIYATSAFNSHSLISTVLVVQNLCNGRSCFSPGVCRATVYDTDCSVAVIKSPMAKIADVFGRFEAFCVSVLIYVLGYIAMAVSNDVSTYTLAQVLYSAGSTGLQILQQVFIADSSDLLDRALLSATPEMPFLVTVWIGPTIARETLKHASWRWGYGIWSIILPASFFPLALTLLVNQRKAKRLNLIKQRSEQRLTFFTVVKRTWYDLDVFGLLLLSAGVTLILVPLTLTANAKTAQDRGIVSMIVVGLVCLLLFPFWETSKRLAPTPLLSLHLLRQRTALAGCALAFFYFSTPSFPPPPFLLCDLHISCQLTRFASGFLLLCAAVPQLLPPSGAGVRCCNGRPCFTSFCVYLNSCCIWGVNTN